jgi:hypothetical protein
MWRVAEGVGPAAQRVDGEREGALAVVRGQSFLTEPARCQDERGLVRIEREVREGVEVLLVDHLAQLWRREVEEPAEIRLVVGGLEGIDVVCLCATKVGGEFETSSLDEAAELCDGAGFVGEQVALLAV